MHAVYTYVCNSTEAFELAYNVNLTVQDTGYRIQDTGYCVLRRCLLGAPSPPERARVYALATTVLCTTYLACTVYSTVTVEFSQPSDSVYSNRSIRVLA